ncbi:hypothetical protein BVI1335_870027 [Burkholderia vietnamiensis]|nr:hypothetical protein BVI1335_870027 [Burkholderia vietnamiensis]
MSRDNRMTFRATLYTERFHRHFLAGPGHKYSDSAGSQRTAQPPRNLRPQSPAKRL